MAEDTCSSEAAITYTHTPGEGLTGAATCRLKPIQMGTMPSIAWHLGLLHCGLIPQQAHDQMFMKGINSSAGVTPREQITTVNHDEGQVHYATPEPPTATVGELLGVSPIYYLGEGALPWRTALPALPPPVTASILWHPGSVRGQGGQGWAGLLACWHMA
ncbi:hypothetical protein JB92DRAFT_2830110 [Gautieria morchelliformis]|nr:hypothetical protein JB92DRAFT_2830110 [Gautieria morchelliformis]